MVFIKAVKNLAFLIYALGVDLLTTIRELGYQYEQDSVVVFHYPLKSAFFEKKEG